MSRGYYRRLAKTNITKNGRIYLPYIITGIICVMMMYLIKSLSINPGFEQMIGEEGVTMCMMYACWVARIFVVIFILYTNSFLVKRRKKELGVFHILGMEKKHISLVLLLETLYISAITIGVGLVLGIAMDKLMFMVILRMLGVEIPLGFFISSDAIVVTILLFAAIYVITWILNVFQIHAAKPVELLRGSDVGEKEPKTKFFMALLGVISLAAGYYLAVTTENPMSSMNVFFIAVLLVILGTYCLFTAGSIAFLKILKKNKRYYYKTNHFVSVSGMLYRMKQNAVGLASICILSTMVLVTVSFTSSMMVGFEDILRQFHPKELEVYASGISGDVASNMIDEVKQRQQSLGLQVTDEVDYQFLSYCAMETEDGFETDYMDEDMDAVEKVKNLVILSEEDYNRIEDVNLSLKNQEALVIGVPKPYEKSEITLFDNTFSVKKGDHIGLQNNRVMSNVVDSYFVVVKDREIVQRIYEKQLEIYGEAASDLTYYYGFDTSSSPDEEIAFQQEITVNPLVAETGIPYIAESREADRVELKSIYGGVFFIGIFLGSLFLMAAVLIIYYKQISEGYDDKRRFTIMQQVGMTEKEVSKTIRSQVLTVFFMPLIVAGIHLIFAFPLLEKMLNMFSLTDKVLYGKCLVGCYIVFALIYVGVYHLTAKTYHKIIKR